MDEILVLCTTDTPDLARDIASALVEAREAACVSIVPAVRSIYLWQGEICDEQECILVVKSTAENFEAVRSRIRLLHTYKIPEIIAVPIAAGDPSYLAWLRSCLAKE